MVTVLDNRTGEDMRGWAIADLPCGMYRMVELVAGRHVDYSIYVTPDGTKVVPHRTAQ